MRASTRSVGARAEALVVSHLEQLGWSIEARNWRAAGGELDIVARDAHGIRFIEVKARRSSISDDPLERIVSTAQWQRIQNAAEEWLNREAEPHPTAGDVSFMLAYVDMSIEPWPVTLFEGPLG